MPEYNACARTQYIESHDSEEMLRVITVMAHVGAALMVSCANSISFITAFDSNKNVWPYMEYFIKQEQQLTVFHSLLVLCNLLLGVHSFIA